MEKSFYGTVGDLRHGNLVKLYVIYHVDDNEVLRYFTREIENAMVQHDPQCKPETVFHSAQTTTFSQAVMDAKGGDLFSSQVIVIYTGFDYLTASVKAQAMDEITPELEAIFKESLPAPMILVTAAEKLDERKKWTKRFLQDKEVCVIHAGKWRRDEWRSLITEWMDKNLTLSTSQMDFVIERSGDSFGLLYQNMQKITTYALSEQALQDQVLRELVPDESESDLFHVIRLAIEGNLLEAHRVFHELSSTESSFALLSLLSRQYRLIARVSDPRNKMQADRDLAIKLGVHPYACKVAREQSKYISAQRCREQLIDLAELEYKIKSGQVSEQTAIDWWFLRGTKGA